MCGRFTLKGSLEDLARAFPFLELPEALPVRYNIAPTQEVAAVTNEEPRRVAFLRWGLIPFFAKDPAIGDRMINARGETLAEKPSFRHALRRRRCLVLADGFYEWRKNPDGKTKTPIYIRLRSGEPFAFAGLWDTWRPKSEPEAEPVRSCTIVTIEPNDLLAPIHDRMPAILPPDAVEAWLDPEERPSAELLPLLGPYPSDEMIAHPVSTLVNSPRNDRPECVRPAGA